MNKENEQLSELNTFFCGFPLLIWNLIKMYTNTNTCHQSKILKPLNTYKIIYKTDDI